MILDFELFIITTAKYYQYSCDRLAKLKLNLDLFENLKEKNIQYVGIDGAKLINKKINKKYIEPSFILDPRTGVGGLGCALSHICILKKIEINKIYKHILVLEEDAILNSNFFEIFNHIPEDYDLAFLHSYLDINYFEQPINPQNKYFRKIENLITKDCGAMCYLINGNNIKNIVKDLLPVNHGLDWHYLKPKVHNFKKLNNLNKYIVNPDLKLCNNPNPVSLRETLDKKFLDSQIKIH